MIQRALQYDEFFSGEQPELKEAFASDVSEAEQTAVKNSVFEKDGVIHIVDENGTAHAIVGDPNAMNVFEPRETIHSDGNSIVFFNSSGGIEYEGTGDVWPLPDPVPEEGVILLHVGDTYDGTLQYNETQYFIVPNSNYADSIDATLTNLEMDFDLYGERVGLGESQKFDTSNAYKTSENGGTDDESVSITYINRDFAVIAVYAYAGEDNTDHPYTLTISETNPTLSYWTNTLCCSSYEHEANSSSDFKTTDNVHFGERCFVLYANDNSFATIHDGRGQNPLDLTTFISDNGGDCVRLRPNEMYTIGMFSNELGVCHFDVRRDSYYPKYLPSNLTTVLGQIPDGKYLDFSWDESVGNMYIINKNRTVSCYGGDPYDVFSDIENVYDVVQISAHNEMLVMLKSDKTVRYFGKNTDSQNSCDGLTKVVRVLALQNSVACLFSDGSIQAFGAIKSNYTFDESTVSGAKNIAISDHHLLYVDSDGNLQGFGKDDQSQLTNKTGVAVQSVDVPTEFENSNLLPFSETMSTDFIKSENVFTLIDGPIFFLINSDGSYGYGGDRFNGFDVSGIPGGTAISKVKSTLSIFIALGDDGNLYPNQSSSNPPSVGSWTDIVDFDISGRVAIGVKSDGSVLYDGGALDGTNDDMYLNLPNWTNISKIYATDDDSPETAIVIGLKNDGTLEVAHNSSVSNEPDWSSFTGVKDVGVATQMVALHHNDDTLTLIADRYGDGYAPVAYYQNSINHIRTDGVSKILYSNAYGIVVAYKDGEIKCYFEEGYAGSFGPLIEGLSGELKSVSFIFQEGQSSIEELAIVYMLADGTIKGWTAPYDSSPDFPTQLGSYTLPYQYS